MTKVRIIKNFLDKKITQGIGTNNSFNRDNWIINQLSKIPEGLKLLDAGAGEAKYKNFCTHLIYTSQDIAIYDGVGNNQGIQKITRDYSKLDIISDIYKIPVESSSYDVILCTEVLEHITDPINVFKEFNRILKKDGMLIITAPFNSLVHYSPFHYFTGFSTYFYKYHLPKFGFEIEEIEANGNYFEYISQEIRRLNNIASRYSFLKTGFFTKISIKILLNFMQKAVNNDTNSHELLCYGFHIKSVKKSNLGF